MLRQIKDLADVIGPAYSETLRVGGGTALSVPHRLGPLVIPA